MKIHPRWAMPTVIPLLVFVIVMCFSTPNVGYAQTSGGSTGSSSNAQATVTPGFFRCVKILRKLGRGSRGQDVKDLQVALDVDPTGFFGPVTEQAVIDFQIKNGIVIQRVDGGSIGPKTRDFLGRACKNASVTVTMGTTSPFKVNFTGPARLKVGENGTWKLQVTNPTQGNLAYMVNWITNTSYVPYADMVAAIKEGKGTAMTSNDLTLSHSYGGAGAYQVMVAVRSSTGESALASTWVIVGQDSTTLQPLTPSTDLKTVCPMVYAPVCGKPQLCIDDAICITGSVPQTYENRCMLDAAKAKFMSEGPCPVPSVPSSTSASCFGGQCATPVPAPAPAPDITVPGATVTVTMGTTTPSSNSSTNTNSNPAGTCAHNGVTYKTGYARQEGMTCDDGRGCWNSARLFVCRSGNWVQESCGFPNMTGPFPNNTAVPNGFNDSQKFYSCNGDAASTFEWTPAPSTPPQTTTPPTQSLTVPPGSCVANNTVYGNGAFINSCLLQSDPNACTTMNSGRGSNSRCTEGRWVTLF